MAIKHVVRCDFGGCGKEDGLIDSASTPALTGYLVSPSYLVPSEWKQVDGRDFCSWGCLASYAEWAQKQGKR